MIAARRMTGFAALGLLALVAAGALDLTLDEGRVLYAALGRDRLVEACTPALIRELIEQGFSPQDVEIEGRPALGLGWGRGRSIDAGFSFQDGGAETRVDGTMSCTIEPPGVRVVFRTQTKPIRIG